MAAGAGATTVSLPSPPGDMAALQRQINSQLASTSGGVQIAPNVVSYRSDTVRVVLPLPGPNHRYRTVDVVGAAHVPVALTTRYARATHRWPWLRRARIATSYTDGCPYGYTTHWSCFYANPYFNHNGTDGGRMLEFTSCNYYQYLHSYNFQNQTSSWVNTKTHAWVNTYDGNWNFLWTEHYSQTSGWVGSANNDRADPFEIYTDSSGNCEN